MLTEQCQQVRGGSSASTYSLIKAKDRLLTNIAGHVDHGAALCPGALVQKGIHQSTALPNRHPDSLRPSQAAAEA